MEPRRLIIAGDIALVPLSNGMFSLIDAEFANFIGEFNWCFLKPANNKHFYARRNIYKANGVIITELLHRVIWEYKFGDIPNGFEIDHIVRENTLDNRLNNLRLADRRGQMQNLGIPSNAAERQSNLVGVHWHSLRHKWVAHIHCSGKNIHLGYYDTDELGYGAYYWALKLMGENPPINHKRDHPQKLIISAKTRAFVEKQLLKYGVDLIG